MKKQRKFERLDSDARQSTRQKLELLALDKSNERSIMYKSTNND